MSESTSQLLSKAKQLCANRGVRFTPIRQQVFQLMAQHGTVVSAYDLLDQLKQFEPGAKPPTVYRALDFLLEQGFIHKVESNNAFILCPHFGEDHPLQLLICDSCGSAVELHNPQLDELLMAQAEAHGFSISSKTVEAHGICADCQQ